MSTAGAPRDLDARDRDDRAGDAEGELRLDPQVHGPGRVPGQRRAGFDLVAFAAALEKHDVVHQLSWYAPGADIRVVDPDGPPPTARSVRGLPAISSWLAGSDALGVEVTHLVDGGDRVAFTERRRQRDGTLAVGTSTAELTDGLITLQHTIIARSGEPREQSRVESQGWTQQSDDLWTRTD